MEELSAVERRLEELLETNFPQELFLMEDGQAMEFSMNISSPQSIQIIKLSKSLIEKGGGNLSCNVKGPNVITLLVDGEVSFVTSMDFFKLNFVLDSAHNHRLQDLNDYRANKSRFTDSVDVNDILYGIKSWSDCIMNKEEVSDDELFEDCEEPKGSSKHSKYYSKEEDIAILEYILSNRLHAKVKGNTIWQSMEQKQICPERSWNSLKERYIKRIVPNLSSFKVSVRDQEIIKSGFSGTCIPQNSVDSDSTTDDEFLELKENTEALAEETGQTLEPCRELSLPSNLPQETSEEAMETLESDMPAEEEDSKCVSTDACDPCPLFLSPENSDMESVSGGEEQKENTPPDEEQPSPSVSKSPVKNDGENCLRAISPHNHKRFRFPFSTREDEAIIEFLHKNSARQRVKGNEIWKTLEKRKFVKGRTWQSLKERFVKRILPNLQRFSSNEALKPALEYLEQIQSKKPAKRRKRERRYQEKEDIKILTFIIDNHHYAHVKGRSMWVEMENKWRGRRSWHSLRERFLKVISKNLSKYDVITKEQRRKLMRTTEKTHLHRNVRAEEVSTSDSDSSAEEDAPQAASAPSSENDEESLPAVTETRSEEGSDENEPSSERHGMPVISLRHRRVKRTKRINL